MSTSAMTGKDSFSGLLLRHLAEDINAYNYDRAYCENSLQKDELTPQEARTLRLRLLDLNHQTRACRHKMDILRELPKYHDGPIGAQFVINSLNPVNHAAPATETAAIARPLSVTPPDALGLDLLHQASMSLSPPMLASMFNDTQPSEDEGAPPPKKTKRKRASGDVAGTSVATEENPGHMVQRKGVWDCRLCTSVKYATAPQPRHPMEASTWPLRDVSKMITHFTDLHGEHTPAERCQELGAALQKNRGPFRYWLTRTKNVNIPDDDESLIDQCVTTLLSGRLPGMLRRLAKSAAKFPEDDEDDVPLPA